MEIRTNSRNPELIIAVIISFLLLVSNIYYFSRNYSNSRKAKELAEKNIELDNKVKMLESKVRYLKTLASQ